MRQRAGKPWSVDGILRDTLLLATVPGLRPVDSLSNARIDTHTGGWSERPITERSIWEWDADGLNQVNKLSVRHRMLRYEPVLVCDQIKWEPPTAVSIHGNRYQLPFTKEFLISTYSLADYGYLSESSSGLWQIPANLHSSFQRVFGYEVHPKTGKLRPIARAALNHLQLMAPYDNRRLFEARTVNHGDVIEIVPLRLIVCIALGCAAERNNFEPAGVLSAARLHPHTMVMANMPLESIEASIVIKRPSARAPDPDHPEACHMTGGETMDPNISAGLYTDRNDEHSLPVPQLPTWDNIFDYYDTQPQLGHEFKVVESSRPHRNRENAVETFVGIPDTRPDSVVMQYAPRSITKVARQGEFDNLHLAPKMRVPSEVLANHPAFAQTMSSIAMAPFCIHDCLHTHWRWGITGFDRKHLRGWAGTADDIGDPHQVAGAPMVPPNQDVTVSLLSPSSFRYSAKASQTQPSVWQAVMHHGSAYAISLSSEFAAGAVAAVKGLLRDFTRGVGMPWSVLYWNLRYGAYREQSAERIRLSESRLRELRSL